MKFILNGLGNSFQNWPLIKEATLLAEKLGYWAVLLPDHFNLIPRTNMSTDFDPDATLESWIALSNLSALTNTIKLGTLVTPVPLRPPAILAKLVATLDNISGGRAILGVGAGDFQKEFEGYSQWDEPRTRVQKTREGLEFILRLWKEDSVSFKGKYYSSKDTVLKPKPVQKPHPPLLFGGRGLGMLKLAGQYADICNIQPWNLNFEETRKIVLKEADKFGRKNEISFCVQRKSSKFSYGELSKAVEEAKCDYFIIGFELWLSREETIYAISKFGNEILPAFK